ncbi:MAG: hypothetical protein STSR0009_19810 [Methanoregula sp.]
MKTLNVMCRQGFRFKIGVTGHQLSGGSLANSRLVIIDTIISQVWDIPGKADGTNV